MTGWLLFETLPVHRGRWGCTPDAGVYSRGGGLLQRQCGYTPKAEGVYSRSSGYTQEAHPTDQRHLAVVNAVVGTHPTGMHSCCGKANDFKDGKNFF